MHTSSSRHYQEQIGSRFSVRLLVQSYRILLALLVILTLAQIVITFVWVNTCTEIYGLSLYGRVFDTDSLTCPLPGVEPLYPR